MNSQISDRNAKSTSAFSGLGYLLVGGGIGAAVALLFAPKNGTALRQDISETTRKSYGGTLDLARRVKEQSTGIYHSLVDKVKKFEEGAGEILDSPTERKAYKRGPDKAARDSYGSIRTKPRESSRKSTSIV